MKIVLISCTSKKLKYKTNAKDLYISPSFKSDLKHANSLKPDKIFILSAKHGLLKLNDQIKPYDKTLNNLSKSERQKWAKEVLIKLKKEIDINNDKVIFLAGDSYREFLIPYIKNYEINL